MARPTGITFLSAILIFTGSCAAILGVSVLRNPGQLDLWIPPEFLPIGPRALGAVLIFSGLLNLALGWGLLKLMNWARLAVLGIAGLSLIGATLGILTGGLTHDPIGMDVRRLVVFAIYGLIVWYLLRPESTKAFTPRPRDDQPGVPPTEPPAPTR
jgi:hypothetical protein